MLIIDEPLIMKKDQGQYQKFKKFKNEVKKILLKSLEKTEKIKTWE